MKKNVNLFNALETIRTLAKNNEEIISRLDAVEEGLKEVVATIDTLATVKVITEVNDGIDFLKKQEETRKSIIDYIVEHGKRVIVPVEIWNEWNKIITGSMFENIITLHDMLYIANPNRYKNVEIEMMEWGREIRLSISASYSR